MAGFMLDPISLSKRGDEKEILRCAVQEYSGKSEEMVDHPVPEPQAAQVWVTISDGVLGWIWPPPALLAVAIPP